MHVGSLIELLKLQEHRVQHAELLTHGLRLLYRVILNWNLECEALGGIRVPPRGGSVIHRNRATAGTCTTDTRLAPLGGTELAMCDASTLAQRTRHVMSPGSYSSGSSPPVRCHLALQYGASGVPGAATLDRVAVAAGDVGWKRLA